MEQWEIDLRAKLELEVENGYYQIGSNGWVVGTGKGGYINYQVALVKAAKEYVPNRGVEDQIKSCPSSKHDEATEQDFTDLINALRDYYK